MTFTVTEALQIQKDQLSDWKSVLKPQIFKELKSWIDTKNQEFVDNKFKTGYTVTRGGDITNWVRSRARSR